MLHIDKNNIPKELKESENIILFGAGSSGKVCKRLLEANGMNIKFFVDDDKAKRGKFIENTLIISYDELLERCKKKEMYIVMTSIYGKTILQRLKDDFHNEIKIYEMYEWFLEEVPSFLTFEIDNHALEEFKKNIDDMENYWEDKFSHQVLVGIYNYFKIKDIQIINNICSAEDQYFISEVMEAIKSELVIIDAGACEGELVEYIERKGIKFDKCYCFEANDKMYSKLKERAKNNSYKKQICINKGLWKEQTILYFDNTLETGSRIVDEITDSKIETITIDEYFKDIHFNFIKMDIEGAEFQSLQGGINKIIEERPILAISIYHSLDDFYRIPQYLKEKLKDYSFYIRHHSLIGSETILYGIPKELQYIE